MTLDEFWGHVKASKRRDPEAHAERLVKRLVKLPPDAIIDFDHWWDTVKQEAYRWNLWGAAYTINGGCSDDGFIDFRSWLVLQGREVFQAALADPDSLADVVDGEDEEATCECYPASRAWFQATGTEENTEGYAAQHAAYEARHPRQTPAAEHDMGENWDFDDYAETRRRLPRLASMYHQEERGSDGEVV